LELGGVKVFVGVRRCFGVSWELGGV